MEGEQRLFDDPERMRRGMRSVRRELTPTEEEIAKTVGPDQLALEGLQEILRVQIKDPVEDGWEPKPSNKQT